MHIERQTKRRRPIGRYAILSGLVWALLAPLPSFITTVHQDAWVVAAGVLAWLQIVGGTAAMRDDDGTLRWGLIVNVAILSALILAAWGAIMSARL